MDAMKKYRNFQDCARIYITIPRTYINRQVETNKQITKRIHDIILYRIFNVNDTLTLAPRTHQKHDSTTNNGSGNVICFVENTYPQNIPVRVMDTTMVLLKYYNDNNVENTNKTKKKKINTKSKSKSKSKKSNKKLQSNHIQRYT